MNMMKTTAALLLLSILLSVQSDYLPKPFVELLDRAKMHFEKPFGLETTPLIENRQMNYEYALKYPKKQYEIRYAVRPLDQMIAQHEEAQRNKKEGDVSIHPNKLYSAMLTATVLNVSGGKNAEITPFNKNDVKDEFNADWGATAFFEVGEEFGQDYKYCLVVALHKDDCADAYIFYLAKTKKKFTELMNLPFYALKFK
jgi:hypothetical protein